jgi:hypothetical protein
MNLQRGARNEPLMPHEQLWIGRCRGQTTPTRTVRLRERSSDRVGNSSHCLSSGCELLRRNNNRVTRSGVTVSKHQRITDADTTSVKRALRKLSQATKCETV